MTISRKIYVVTILKILKIFKIFMRKFKQKYWKKKNYVKNWRDSA